MSAAKPALSFLIPVYNERNNVKQVVDHVLSLPINKEIILVDDGSVDGTQNVLAQLKDPVLKIFYHDKNQGKGAAVRTALTHANAEAAAIQDADLEYDPAEYLGLLKLVQSNECDVVFGSRFLKDNPLRYFRYYAGNKMLTWFINFLCDSRITDSYTCFKLMKLDTWRSLNLTARGFELEAEISVKVAMRKFRYKECAINYKPRLVEEGKKINWKDAVKGAVCAFTYWREERK